MATTEETRPIFLICGCQKYRPYLEAAVKRYANPTRWLTIGLLGDPGATEARIEDSGSGSGTALLIVPNPDTYESLPAKIQAAIEWIHRTWPRVPGVFKTDDDILFPDRALLERTIRMNRSNPYWGLYVGRCPAATIPRSRIESRFTDKSTDRKYSHQAAHYCFGAGYWIGAPSLPIVASAKEAFSSSVLEDVCMGYVLNHAGVFPTKILIPVTEAPRGPELLRAK